MDQNGFASPVLRPLVAFWAQVSALWVAIKPAWPLWAGSILAIVVMFGTGQGNQALLAVIRSPLSQWPFWMTFATLLLHGAIVHGGFLQTTRHRSQVAGVSVRRHHTQRWLAAIFGLSLPAAIGIGLIVQTIESHTLLPEWSLASLLSAEVWRDNGPGIVAAFVCAIGLLALHLAVVGRFFRIIDTPFSQIATIDRRQRRNLYILFAVAFAAVLAVNISPAVRDAIGPIGIFLLALSVLGLILTYFVSVLMRNRLPSLLFLLVLSAIVAVAASYFRDSRYHEVQKVEKHDLTARCDSVPDAIANNTLPCAGDHAKAWLRARLADEGEIPVVVVLAEGGGIYAAFNVAGTLARLEEASRGGFMDHVYVMSGVSGGSIGLATYLAGRADLPPVPAQTAAGTADTAGIFDSTTDFLGDDFLSPIMVGLLFRDLVFRMVPIFDLFPEDGVINNSIKDRADLFEHKFECAWQETAAGRMPRDKKCDAGFHQGFEHVVERAKPDGLPAPIVLFNTSRVRDGRQEVVSNVIFDSDTQEKSWHLYNVLDLLPRGQTLPLSAAAHMSARFPVVSPTAMLHLRPDGHDDAKQKTVRRRYVDGGYMDNSGALTARRAIAELYGAAADIERETGAARGAISRRLNVIVVNIFRRSIFASDSEAQAGLALENTNWVQELYAPVKTVLAVRAARGAAALESFCLDTVSRYESRDRSRDLNEFCPALGQYRKLIRSDAGAQADIEKTGIVAATRTTHGVNWINAPLDISQNPAHPAYVPLGWYMGESQTYAKRKIQQIAAPVCDALRNAIADADKTARWQCG